MSQKIKHWSEIKEKAAGYKRLILTLKIYKILGKRTTKFISYFVVFFTFLASKNLCNSSTQYLNLIYKIKQKKGDYSFKKPNSFMVFKHLLSFADSLIDRMSAWLGEMELSDINIKTRKTYNNLLADLENNKGAFFICSHIGNVEVLRALGKIKTANLLKKELKINAIMQIEHCSHFKNLLKEINPEFEANLISAIDIGVETAIELKDKLHDGEITVTAGDRTAAKNKEKVVAINFLGKEAYFPMGSFILAKVMESPVYFVFCMKKDQKSQYDFYLYKSKFITGNNGKTKPDMVNNAIKEYGKYLERLCVKYPLQWYNFFNFWQKPF